MNHMTIKDSCIGLSNASKMLQDSNELLSLFYYNLGHQPCSVKIVWKSQFVAHGSMVFPKGSPLLPFFNYAYIKIRQNGALHRIKKKWVLEHKSNCQSNTMQPISFQKIVSLFTLLFFGISSTFIILVIEIYFKKKIVNPVVDPTCRTCGNQACCMNPKIDFNFY